MVAAAISDIATMTISNRLSAALAVAFFAAAPVYGLTMAEVGAHALAGFMVLVVGVLFFSRGWIGGGDAKIAAGAALWLGFGPLTDFVAASALFGGGLTLLILVFRWQMLPAFAARQDWIARLHNRSSGVPYGVAIAAGALYAFPATPFVRLATGG